MPLLIGFAFSNAIPRYFIAVAPALYLLLGIGFANFVEYMKPKLRKQQFYILHFTFYIFLFALILPDYSSLAKIAHYQWDKLANWVEQQSTVSCQASNVRCLVIVNPHSEILPFERYYRGTLPVVGFYPREDNDSRDLRIVKTNWVSLVTKENVRPLRDITQGFNRVFLITGEIDQTTGRDLVPLWFWENGWRKAESQSFGRLPVIFLERLSLQSQTP